MARSCCVLSAFLLLCFAPAFAQDLTEEQILQRFEAQREVLRDNQTMPKTRGFDMISTPDSADGQPAGTQDAGKPASEVVFAEVSPELQVNLAIRFAFDSAVIAPDQRPALEKMCAVMRKSDIGMFRIIGHTDVKGSASYNENLSRLRAEEVRRWLVRDCGIAATRMEAIGMGKKFLANPENPLGSENRRVEFQAIS